MAALEMKLLLVIRPPLTKTYQLSVLLELLEERASTIHAYVRSAWSNL